MAGTWIFLRGIERMEVRRHDADAGGSVIIRGAHHEVRWFDTIDALVAFQNDLEQRLVAEGWSLNDYFPDRRLGLDRRSASRDNERRHVLTFKKTSQT